jgi:VWFA-related protein
MAGSRTAVLLSILLLVASASIAKAQTAGTPVAPDGPNAATPAVATAQQPSGTPSTESEISTHDSDTDFKVQVNLVLVRVVVRDSNGNAVASLRKEDFRLLDGGKPQTISTFTLETPESRAIASATNEAPKESSAPPAVSAQAAPASPPIAIPQRFVALVLDDVHFQTRDALAVRDAITRLSGAISSADRVAVYTTSGEVTQEFTDDREAIHKILLGIVPRAGPGKDSQACNDLSYYEADLIVNREDLQALAAATLGAKTNCGLGGQDVLATARRVLTKGDADTRDAYHNLEAVIRHMSNMPGQRVIVLVSPGFVMGEDVQPETWTVIDRAVRSGIVINTIDARGLYTADVLPDIAAPPQRPPDRLESQLDWQGLEATYRTQAQFEQGVVLQGAAASTGGTYFHNRNDLDAGIRQALAAPAISYLLGFSPSNLNRDGRFHNLKVSLTNGEKYQIQARNGYFAPKIISDPEEMAKQEVRDQIFAQDEILSIPVQMTTQFFKLDAGSARLTVLTHLDLKGVRFRRADGRNDNNLTIATVVFDRNGQFVKGEMKEITFKLKDTTYERMHQSGFTIKMAFDVKPGTYIVRTVVRGSEGPQLTAHNGTAVIPD